MANNKNLIAAATLTPSAVKAVANAVSEILQARTGTAQLKITGNYSGFDDATYDFQIVDGTASTKLVSTPVFNGAGSETLANIAATTVTPQSFELECHSAGQPAVSAAVEIEGVNIVARAGGTAGNLIHIGVDTTGLTFASSAFSLIEDVKKGAGADGAPLDGPQYDWNTATVGADGNIPAAAPRIAFDGDRSNVYVQYKKYANGKWNYYFVPELQNDYPAGTKVLVVTGTYTVTITNGTTTDTLSSITTVYDFLNKVKTTSVLCDVVGVIANDRSPTGQAARDFPVRTTARALLSTGSGSKAATGFVDVTVATANTELVTAECTAIDFTLDPLAYVGHEAWKLKGSVSGELGTIYTGEPYSGATFGLTIPKKVPSTNANQTGRFSMTDVQFVTRAANESTPEVCFAGKLGPNAVDQTITLKYTRRLSLGCACEQMPVPELDGACLGTVGTGGAVFTYTAAGLVKLQDLYDWGRDLAAAVTKYNAAEDIPPGPSLTAATGLTASSTVSGPGFTGTLVSAPTSISGPNVLVPSNPVTTGWADVALPQNFQDLLDFYEKGLQAIDVVTDSTLHTAGLTQFSAALTAWKNDLDSTALTTLGHRIASLATDKYKVLVKRAMAYAGVSPLGKTDASTLESGDGCWQDFGDSFFWEVVGSVGGKYAPLFTSQAYWASRLSEIDGKEAYYTTKEFAVIINIACPNLLKEGDTITLAIGNAAKLGLYQVGDVLKLPLIAAADLYLTGGIAANVVQKWYLTGSIDGAFAVYTFDPGSPTTYSSGGIAFLLVMGGVPPAAGDVFTFTVEGGHFKWRKNGGAWSSSTAIPAAATAFDSGLSYQFLNGANPSFVALDTWSFKALQPWSGQNVKTPDRSRWFPGVAGADQLAVFSAIKPLDGIGVAMHTIPQGATITLTGGDVIGITDWTETITWQAGAIGAPLSQSRTGIWVRLTLASAADGSIGWWWVGVMDQTEYSANFTPSRDYAIERGAQGGLYQGGAFLGKAIGGTVEWTPGSLSEADAAKLVAMTDWTKSNDDEPLLYLPQVTRPDVLFARIVEDRIDTPDLFDYQPDVSKARRLSAKLTLQGVWG